MDKRIIAAAAGAVVAALSPLALANPYAGTVSESAGQVTFRLNEQADEVIVIRDGVSTSLGALGRGSHTFARSGAAVYQIVARKAGTDGYQHASAPNTGTVNQFSDDNLVNQLRSNLHAKNFRVQGLLSRLNAFGCINRDG